MLRHLLLLIICSILVIFFLHAFSLIIYAVVYLHSVFSHFFAHIFAGGAIGVLARQTISLVIVPIIITVLPGLIYWLLTRREVGYFYWLTWAIWLMLATALALHR